MELVQTVLDPELPLLFKEEALGLLQDSAGTGFGYDTDADDNPAAEEKMKRWAREAREP